MNNKFKVFSLVLFILFSFFFCNSNILAEEKENEKNFYCALCTYVDEEDPLYEKERQFYYKVKKIKDTYGSSIDEPALVAAVVHRYVSNEAAYEATYDKNFDSEEYGDTVSRVYSMINSSSLDASLIVANEKIDLLTLASIVMVDSNHNQKYSDVCFRDALAGNRLVGNDKEKEGDNSFVQKIFDSVINKITCVKAKIQVGEYKGDSTYVAEESEKLRVKNIDYVCNNGYVGGLYSSVRNMTDETKKKSAKRVNAQGIIDLAKYYRDLYGSGSDEGEMCNTDIAGQTGEYANWRQSDDRWGSISLGGASSVRKAGCLVTSISMQISRSGTKIGTLPPGYSEFNPGAFVTSLNKNAGFVGGGNFGWKGFNTIAPNWGVGEFVSLGVNNNSALTEAIRRELSSGYGANNYQKFLVLQIHHSKSAQHWVAVNGIENNKVTIFDPSHRGTTLDDNYTNWVVDGYRIMYATDVKFGELGSTTNNTCNGSSNGGSVQGILSFIRYVEGDTTCNYRGQGEGTGYTTENLNDGAGITTALGITEEFDKGIANDVGYSDFVNDLHSGCTSKENIDKMFPKTIQSFIDYVDAKASDLNLNDYERYAIASVGYGGYNLADNVINSIRKYGKTSEEVYKCFKSYGCGFFGNSAYTYGLSLRRMAEYEIFSTGNYNAARPEYLGSYGAVQATSLSQYKSTWPTKRDYSLWDGTTVSEDDSTGTSSGTKGVYCENGAAHGVSNTASSLNYSGSIDIPDYLWKNHDSSGDPSIVVADDSGNVVASRKADIRREGGSTNKVFTGYSALKLLDVKNDVIKGSKYVYNISNSSHDHFGPGQTMSVAKAATLTFPGSKNRVADSIVLTIGYKYCNCNSDKKAYATGIDKMNELFKQTGCTNTNIGTGSGINGIFGSAGYRGYTKQGITKDSNGNGFSAGDLALVTMEAMKDNNFANHFGNRNKEGLFYIKSGTQQCGHGVWGFNKNGKRYYMVILGVKCGYKISTNQKTSAKFAIRDSVYNWAIKNAIK